MTFNYSRGIGSITHGLGAITADDVIDRIVKGELTVKDKLVSGLMVGYGFKTEAALREALIKNDPSTIGAKYGMGKKNMYTYLSDMGTNTYGHLAAKSLTENFGKFVQANEVINKGFAEIFVEYHKAYLEKVLKVEDDQGKGITKQQDLDIIQSLRAKFPLIKGPYSHLADLSDNIAIYDNINADAKHLEASYGSATTKLANNKNKKIQSKIKQLKAAIKAGSVIPIHYIDGAVMGNTILESEGGILGIHDAIIPNLLKMKEVVKTYNKNTIGVNAEYSVVEALLETYNRVFPKPTEAENIATVEDLTALVEEAKAMREELFSHQIDVVHMSAVPGSKYTHNGNVEAKAEIQYNDKQKEALKEFFNKSQVKKLLPEDMNFKDC